MFKTSADFIAYTLNYAHVRCVQCAPRMQAKPTYSLNHRQNIFNYCKSLC